MTTNKTSGQSTKHYNLWPRTADDLAGLTAERCTEGTAPTPTPSPDPTPTPTPTPTPPATSGDLIISAYIEGLSNEKYIQISNPTDQEIDLSAYTLLVKNFGKDNKATEGKFAESRIALTGKLAAGASLVLRHEQAKVYTAGTVADFSFNGNDPVALLKGTATIDQIGNGMETAWIDSDKKFAGADIVLHRIASVKAPSATFSADQWKRVPITKENQEATIKSYLGKR